MSNVTNMWEMFNNATLFNGDLSTWNVGNVTDMTGMFSNNKSFNGDVSKWDVSKVTSMKFMFTDAVSFNGDLSTWDVSMVTDMDGMFNRAGSFTEDLSNWDISKVTTMAFMLSNTKLSIATYDALLTKWEALPNLQSNVTLGAHGLTYCDAEVARNALISNKNWKILGDTPCPR